MRSVILIILSFVLAFNVLAYEQESKDYCKSRSDTYDKKTDTFQKYYGTSEKRNYRNQYGRQPVPNAYQVKGTRRHDASKTKYYGDAYEIKDHKIIGFVKEKNGDKYNETPVTGDWEQIKGDWDGKGLIKATDKFGNVYELEVEE